MIDRIRLFACHRMPSENPFRIALVIVIVLTMSVTVYHRLQAASSGEKISRKEEGYAFAIALRLAGLGLWIATFGYLLFPNSFQWASFPLPVSVRWIGVVSGALCSLLMYWTLSSLGKNLTDTVVTRKEATLVQHGPYRFVRHPFYVTAALLMASVTLLTANWLIGYDQLDRPDHARHPNAKGGANADRAVWPRVPGLHGPDGKVRSLETGKDST